MHSFRQDLRFALRQLRKSPGFTTVAVLTLALGIGAATAMFSVIYATVLRPLPFPDPNRIVYVETHAAASYIQPASWPGFQDERAQNQSFEYLAGFSQFAGVNLDTGSQVVHLHNTSTSDHFFDVFGVKPLLGRTFLPGEEQDGRNNVARAELRGLAAELWRQSQRGRLLGSHRRLPLHHCRRHARRFPLPAEHAKPDLHARCAYPRSCAPRVAIIGCRSLAG